MQIRDIEALVNSEKGFVPVPQEGMRSPSIIKDASFGISDGERLSGFAICEEVSATYFKTIQKQKEPDLSAQSLSAFLEGEKHYLYGDDEEGAYLTEVASVTDTGL